MCILSRTRLRRAVPWSAQVDAGSGDRHDRRTGSAGQRSCLECTLDPVVWNGVVDFLNGGSMTQNTIIYCTLIECPLYAKLLMILVDVSMQTCVRVVDENAKLAEHVEIVIGKASTSVTVSATVPCPVGHITHDGLYGSMWDLCGPKDMAVTS